MEVQKEAILTLALNYTFKDLSVFLRSLSNTDFNGTVYLVVNDKIDIPTGDLQFKIEQIVVQDFKLDSVKYRSSLKDMLLKYKRKKITSNLMRNLDASGFTDEKMLLEFTKTYHCQVSRYAIYLIILLNNKFDKVFLTDSRDVYFQSNPFDNCISNGLDIFQENVSRAIKDSWYNKQWVMLSTSFWNYFKIRNKGIYCSGTILGNYDSIVNFLKTFLRYTLKNNLPLNIKGLDQGVFNVLIHTHKLGKYNPHSDQKHVLTLAKLSKPEYRFDESLIYNAQGYPPAVVHQYDRRRELRAFVEENVNSMRV